MRGAMAFICAWLFAVSSLFAGVTSSSSASWGYVEPSTWPGICATGRQQSPIDVVTGSAVTVPAASEVSLDDLITGVSTDVDANGDPLAVSNTGHGLQVNGQFTSLTVAGDLYQAAQFHLHFPSEHALDGELAAAEVHVVHSRIGTPLPEDLLVVGVLFNLGSTDNSFLSKLGLGSTWTAPTPGADPVPLGAPLDVKQELQAALQGNFYHYYGSLTTPGCDETVKWFVLETPLVVSQSQVNAFRATMAGYPMNNRPLQLMNGRSLIKNSFLSCPVEGASTDIMRRLAGGNDFNYVVPQCWDRLFSECGGSRQSPIDIDSTAISAYGSEVLSTNYPALSGLSIKNAGHGLQVDIAGANAVIDDNGDDYNLAQFHLHFPSEHAVDGEVYAGEVHFVHQLSGATGYDSLLVVGVLFELGSSDDPFLEALGLGGSSGIVLPASPSSENVALSGTFDFDDVTNPITGGIATSMDGTFWRYDGSLTTPPCTESVKWHVLQTTLTASQSQVDAFNALSDGTAYMTWNPANNRPVQLRNGRAIVQGLKTTLVDTGLLGCGSEQAYRPASESSSHRRLDGTWEGSYSAPQCWGMTHPKCLGRTQSPINIPTRGPFAGEGTSVLTPTYTRLTGRTVTNTEERGLQVDGAFGSLTLDDGLKYNVAQFHIHCPSEHVFDGQEYPCELHIVHQRDGTSGYDDLLVVGVMYSMGSSSDLLQRMFTYQSGSTPFTVDLQMEYYNVMQQGFYRYDGSLTTPPCDETVKWFVLRSALPMSWEQLDLFKAMFPEPTNNRPPQLLNGRGIFKDVNPGCFFDQSSSSYNYLLPQCWYAFDDYSACAGTSQSPINIDTSQITGSAGTANLSTMITNTADHTGLEVSNTGHGLQVNGNFHTITVDSVAYNALQYHVHFPSEHAMDGLLATAELHIVHQAVGSSGYSDLLVTGIVFTLGSFDDTFISCLGLPSGAPGKDEPPMALTGACESIVLASEFHTELSGDFYHYDGSLTTPPCSETVKWFVMSEVREVSQAQVDAFNLIFKEPQNNRPIQLRNGRPLVQNKVTTSGEAVGAAGCVAGELSGSRRLASWNYVLPQCWAELDDEYAACNGRQQSPVNVDSSIALQSSGNTLYSAMDFHDVASPTVRNTGHGLQIDGNFDSLTVMGARYNALQFHNHFPSEHALDGHIKAAELHIVHQKVGSSDLDDLLVVGVFFNVGSSASSIMSCMGLPSGAPSSSGDEAASSCDPINLDTYFGSILQGSFYHYEGSLTTPPCTESVEWFVMEDMLDVSLAQVNAFKALFGEPMNNRPLQLLGGRTLVKDSFFGCPMEVPDVGSRRLDGGSDPWNYILPQCWGTYYEKCYGTRQSPINIETGAVNAEGVDAIANRYTFASISDPEVGNGGTGLKVSGNTGTFAYSDTETFDALQFHVHFPSEHSVDGMLAAAELHIVHQLCIPSNCVQGANLDNLLVVGLLFDVGAENSIMRTIGLPAGAPTVGAANVGIGDTFTFNGLLPELAGGYYRYDGSLTTPDCTEGVRWFVLESRQTVSQEQIDAFDRLFANPMNNRPIQLRNGRSLIKNMLETNVPANLEGCLDETTGARRLANGAVDYTRPQCWAVTNPACGGRQQSPINIRSGGPFQASGGSTGQSLLSNGAQTGWSGFTISGGIVENTGTSLKLSGPFGTLEMEGETYSVAQFHMHCPSEHTIDGKEFACEMHVVHQKVGATGYDDLLVVGIMYDLASSSNNFLADFTSSAQGQTAMTAFDLWSVYGTAVDGGFYRYDGSLTTPPCTESVSWFVVKTALTMSQAQLDSIKALFADPANNRPVQPLHGRGIFDNTLPGCHVEKSAADWSNSPSGGLGGYKFPQCWAVDYPNCAGNSQSPINIDSHSIIGMPTSMPISLEHTAETSKKVKNNGHGLKVAYTGGHVIFQGNQWNAAQFHIHFPSEHTIDGYLYDAELHVVHQLVGSSGYEDLLVTGVVFARSPPSNGGSSGHRRLSGSVSMATTNAFLAAVFGLEGSFSPPADGSEASIPDAVNVDDLLVPASAGGTNYYHYGGSLTTPPCDETVSWVLFPHAQPISQAQIDAFTSLYALPANNRPIQPTNWRNVYRDSDGFLDGIGSIKIAVTDGGNPASGSAASATELAFKTAMGAMSPFPPAGSITIALSYSRRLSGGNDGALEVVADWTIRADLVAMNSIQTTWNGYDATWMTSFQSALQAELPDYTFTVSSVITKDPDTACISVPLGSWDYSMPQQWYCQYPACSGRQQSPINVDTAAAMTDSSQVTLWDNMVSSSQNNRTVVNTGHGLQVNADSDGGFGYITRLGVRYNTLQFHLHFPSEHAIDGFLTAGELHVVHREESASNYDDLLVIGLMYETGSSTNAFLERILVGAPPSSAYTGANIGAVNIYSELQYALEGSFYAYDGSLTTPPCTESVNWIVLERSETVSAIQVDAFKALFSNPMNNRPLQVLGGRQVVKDSFLGCPLEMEPEDVSRRLSGSQSWNYLLPQCWGLANSICTAGTRQSPINIDTASIDADVTASGGALTPLYPGATNYASVTDAEVVNTGHGLMTQRPGDADTFGFLELKTDALSACSLEETCPASRCTDTGTSCVETRYNLLQFHVHFPSEHALDGLLNDGELHLVHQKQGSSGTDDLLVVGVFLVSGGADSAFLSSYMGLDPSSPFAPDIGEDPAAVAGTVDIVDGSSVAQTVQAQMSGSFFRYDGSLTTPPCSETVLWFVMETTMAVSSGQVALFDSLSNKGLYSNRPLQLRNGRLVTKGYTATEGWSVATPASGCSGEPGRRLSGASVTDYRFPECWAEDYPACGGRQQSPVNIKTQGPFGAEEAASPLMLVAEYSDQTGSVTLTGDSLKVSAPFGSITTIEGEVYKALQFHIHCPSEHTLDGMEFACELHVVHQKVGAVNYDDLLVIGVMYEMNGEADPFVDRLITSATSGNPVTNAMNLGKEFGSAIEAGFYRYDGSLTTPPCTESVSWFVLSTTFGLSQAQLTSLEGFAGMGKPGNNRPVQPLFGRAVFRNTLPGCYSESHLRRLSELSTNSSRLLSGSTGAPWGYMLPQCWAVNYPDCAGYSQSPINVDVSQVDVPSHVSDAVPNYFHIHLSPDIYLRDQGTGFTLEYEGGYLTFSGHTWNILQFHLHFPSEHAIDGELSVGELHAVHLKSGSHFPNDLLVVGLMYELGASNLLLERAVRTGGGIDLGWEFNDKLPVSGGGFYSYSGSLTTPGCTEGQTWLLLTTRSTLSQAQLDFFKSGFQDPMNNRPLQPLNGRSVFCCNGVVDHAGAGHAGGASSSGSSSSSDCECGAAPCNRRLGDADSAGDFLVRVRPAGRRVAGSPSPPPPTPAGCCPCEDDLDVAASSKISFLSYVMVLVSCVVLINPF